MRSLNENGVTPLEKIRMSRRFASKMLLAEAWKSGGPRTISGIDFMCVTMVPSLALFH